MQHLGHGKNVVFVCQWGQCGATRRHTASSTCQQRTRDGPWCNVCNVGRVHRVKRPLYWPWLLCHVESNRGMHVGQLGCICLNAACRWCVEGLATHSTTVAGISSRTPQPTCRACQLMPLLAAIGSSAAQWQNGQHVAQCLMRFLMPYVVCRVADALAVYPGWVACSWGDMGTGVGAYPSSHLDQNTHAHLSAAGATMRLDACATKVFA